MFNDATPERTERMFHYLDPDNTGYIDYLGWSQTIKLQVPSNSHTPVSVALSIELLGAVGRWHHAHAALTQRAIVRLWQPAAVQRMPAMA